MTTDPFNALRALRAPRPAVEPDPGFAAELRDHLRRAVVKGAEMTTTKAPAQAELRSLTPYLAVSDARAALDFYVEVFGAVRRGDPIVMEDGRIGHAELGIGGSVLMLAEEHPEIGHVAAAGGASVRVEVSDVDRSMELALARGAELIRPVTASPYGRGGSFRDPFGQRWLIAQAAANTESEPRVPHGHAGYFTFHSPSADAAKTFYEAVLGWQFSPGRTTGHWQLQGNGMQGGLGSGGQTGWKLMYAVDDLGAAIERVRAQGGRAGEPESQPYGVIADCVDNQGVEFWLWKQ